VAFSTKYRLHLKALFAAVIAVQLQHFADDAAAWFANHLAGVLMIHWLPAKPVVDYRVSPLTYAIAKRVVTVAHVAMANLIAGRRVVPELIQDDFTAANIVQQLRPLLPDGAPRQSMMEELLRIRGLLSTRPGRSAEGGAIDRVAEITLDLMGAAGRQPVEEVERA